jgi:hypothetical protein
MAYKFELDKNTVRQLWQVREFLGGQSIISQIRQAVNQYLRNLESEKIGTTIEDAANAIAKFERERQENHENLFPRSQGRYPAENH